MVDETRIEGSDVTIEAKPGLESFKEVIAQADGRLISLRKATADGRKLYILARYIRNPWEYYKVDTTPGYYDIERKLKEGADKNANPNFYGWNEDIEREATPYMTGVMLTEVFVEQEGLVITPLGHMDWWLSDDRANGGGNMHDARVSVQEHEQLAQRKWPKNDYTAFKVDYDMHRQKLGSLLLATSALVLPGIGVRRFFSGVLLDPAKATYKRFGIREEDFFENVSDRSLPIERLSASPYVDTVISDFV